MDLNEQPEENTPSEKINLQMKIVGYNLLVLLGYGLLSAISARNYGLIFYAFLIFIHFIFTICTALYKRSWVWFLAGVLVLVIGFSTCVGVGNVFG